MSARLSPDGMYYWDGQTWRSTLSADGRFRWDGAAWQPLGPSMVAAPYEPMRPQREATTWTRPIRYAVIGWYVWSIAYTLSLPLWEFGRVSSTVTQIMLRQNPAYTPLPADSTAATAGAWVAVAINVVVFSVIIVGSWKRWTWMHYAVVVLLGLTSLLLPVDLLAIATGRAASATMPGPLFGLLFVSRLLACALFAWMLVALIQRGPWAMRRPQPY